MVICLVRGADLHIAQLMPLPLTVSCSSKIQIGFTFPGKGAVKRVCVCVCPPMEGEHKNSKINQMFESVGKISDKDTDQSERTFPLAKPRSLRHCITIFSVLPDANVRVMLNSGITTVQ